jgi:hypothetical protein
MRMNTAAKLDFWSAITSAVFSVVWFVTFNLKDQIAPVPSGRTSIIMPRPSRLYAYSMSTRHCSWQCLSSS